MQHFNRDFCYFLPFGRYVPIAKAEFYSGELLSSHRFFSRIATVLEYQSVHSLTG